MTELPIRAASSSPLRLGQEDARRLAVAAGIGLPVAGSRAVLRRMGLLQLDPLSRVDKAHRLTCLARMTAATSAESIDRELWQAGDATAFEAWVHAVCLVPVEDWPLLRLHRDAVRDWSGRPPRGVLDEVKSVVGGLADGATISEVEDPASRTSGWNWSARKHAVEHMLRTGELVCTARRGTRRVYDLPERRIPEGILRMRMSAEEILSAIAARAVGAMGIATAAAVAKYYNLTPERARIGLELAGMQQVVVDGWSSPGWIDPAGNLYPISHDPLLIGPFDNLIWDRQRTRRLFDFDYVFEAYKPRAKRVYGYYVLALLHDCRLTGRVDLRRDGGDLLVQGSYPESSVAGYSEFESALGGALEHLRCHLLLDKVRWAL